MRAAWTAWRRAALLIWEHLLPLIILNLLWASTAWLVIPLGPGTLALYWYVARAVRDGEGGLRYVDYYKAMLRFAGRGLLWSLGWAVVLGLGYSNLIFWGQVLPPLAAWTVRLIWVYLIIFLAAMQPSLFESLAMREEGWGSALHTAAWNVLANPVYSHLHLLIPVAALVIAYKTITFMPLVLASLAVVFMAVAAEDVPRKHGEPPPMERRIEDVL